MYSTTTVVVRPPRAVKAPVTVIDNFGKAEILKGLPFKKNWFIPGSPVECPHPANLGAPGMF